MDARAEVSGTVWKVSVAPGDAVDLDQELAVLESMKMEIPVESPVAGTVREVRVRPEDVVSAGAVIAVIDPG
jgi:acetyl-CoA carboxylase biotin carboxyl carrier protein